MTADMAKLTTIPSSCLTFSLQGKVIDQYGTGGTLKCFGTSKLKCPLSDFRSCIPGVATVPDYWLSTANILRVRKV